MERGEKPINVRSDAVRSGQVAKPDFFELAASLAPHFLVTFPCHSFPRPVRDFLPLPFNETRNSLPPSLSLPPSSLLASSVDPHSPRNLLRIRRSRIPLFHRLNDDQVPGERLIGVDSHSTGEFREGRCRTCTPITIRR